MIFQILTALGTVVSLISGFITMYDKSRLGSRSRQTKIALVFTIVTLVFTLIFFGLGIQSLEGNSPGNNGNTTPTVNPRTSPVPKTLPQQQLTPNPTPMPSPTPAPQVGDTPCQADWSSGIDGWSGGTQDWKTLNGILLNDGTNLGAQDPPTLLAPCNLNSFPNYKVEVKIQVQSQTPGHAYGYPSFGLYVRYRSGSSGGYSNNSGYRVGDSGDPLSTLNIAPASDLNLYSSIQNISYSPGTAVHTYTIEVKDNHIRVFIDGGFFADVTDNASLDGGSVGFWDKAVQIAVSSFKVTLV